ncbi:hypothetical protein AAMO2058_001098300 [Amorphochlora amoebiformis]
MRSEAERAKEGDSRQFIKSVSKLAKADASSFSFQASCKLKFALSLADPTFQDLDTYEANTAFMITCQKGCFTLARLMIRERVELEKARGLYQISCRLADDITQWLFKNRPQIESNYIKSDTKLRVTREMIRAGDRPFDGKGVCDLLDTIMERERNFINSLVGQETYSFLIAEPKWITRMQSNEPKFMRRLRGQLYLYEKHSKDQLTSGDLNHGHFDTGNTSIMLAAENGHMAIIKLLYEQIELEKDMKLSVPNEMTTLLETSNLEGWTAPMFAAYNGHRTKYGANVLSCAILGGHLECVHFIVDRIYVSTGALAGEEGKNGLNDDAKTVQTAQDEQDHLKARITDERHNGFMMRSNLLLAFYCGYEDIFRFLYRRGFPACLAITKTTPYRWNRDTYRPLSLRDDDEDFQDEDDEEKRIYKCMASEFFQRLCFPHIWSESKVKLKLEDLYRPVKSDKGRPVASLNMLLKAWKELEFDDPIIEKLESRNRLVSNAMRQTQLLNRNFLQNQPEKMKRDTERAENPNVPDRLKEGKHEAKTVEEANVSEYVMEVKREADTVQKTSVPERIKAEAIRLFERGMPDGALHLLDFDPKEYKFDDPSRVNVECELGKMNPNLRAIWSDMDSFKSKCTSLLQTSSLEREVELDLDKIGKILFSSNIVSKVLELDQMKRDLSVKEAEEFWNNPNNYELRDDLEAALRYIKLAYKHSPKRKYRIPMLRLENILIEKNHLPEEINCIFLWLRQIYAARKALDEKEIPKAEDGEDDSFVTETRVVIQGAVKKQAQKSQIEREKQEILILTWIYLGENTLPYLGENTLPCCNSVVSNTGVA